MIRKFLSWALPLFLLSLLAGLPAQAAEKKQINIGATAGPFSDMIRLYGRAFTR